MQSITRAERRRSRRELAKRPQWGTLEEFARSRIQSWLQDVLEEEVTELLGRSKSERRAVVDAPAGYRNGHGKTRRLSMMSGTIRPERGTATASIQQLQQTADTSFSSGPFVAPFPSYGFVREKVISAARWAQWFRRFQGRGGLP